MIQTLMKDDKTTVKEEACVAIGAVLGRSTKVNSIHHCWRRTLSNEWTRKKNWKHGELWQIASASLPDLNLACSEHMKVLSWAIMHWKWQWAVLSRSNSPTITFCGFLSMIRMGSVVWRLERCRAPCYAWVSVGLYQLLQQNLNTFCQARFAEILLKLAIKAVTI